MFTKIITFPLKLILGIFLPLWLISVTISSNLLDEDFYVGLINKSDILLEVVKKEAMKLDLEKTDLTDKIMAVHREVVDLEAKLDEEILRKEKNNIRTLLKIKRKDERELSKKLNSIIRKEKKFII